jgi:phage terminase small subunit
MTASKRAVHNTKAKLTARQERFVQEYLATGNGSKAARNAGYSERTATVQGSRLLANVNIMEAVSKAQKARSERTEIDADYILTRLDEIIERCLQHKEVLDRRGNPTGQYIFDPSSANRALELLGKHLSLWIDRSEIVVTQKMEAVMTRVLAMLHPDLQIWFEASLRGEHIPVPEAIRRVLQGIEPTLVDGSVQTKKNSHG